MARTHTKVETQTQMSPSSRVDAVSAAAPHCMYTTQYALGWPTAYQWAESRGQSTHQPPDDGDAVHVGH
jgi:hypothetical protein